MHDEFAKLYGQKTGLLHITINPGLHDLSDIEREHKLKEKPQAFLKASFSAAVPNLQAGDLSLDESLDIMFWALEQSVPHGLLNMPDTGHSLITQNDRSFKAALDHTEYATRYPDLSPQIERTKGSDLILTLNIRLIENEFLTVDSPTLADIAIFPFLRQFANIDWTWFDAQPWPQVILWLDGFIQSAEFQTIMTNIPVWQEGASPYIFGHYFE